MCSSLCQQFCPIYHSCFILGSYLSLVQCRQINGCTESCLLPDTGNNTDRTEILSVTHEINWLHSEEFRSRSNGYGDGERNAVTSATKATMEIKCGRNVIVCTIFFYFLSRNSFSIIARIIGLRKTKINDQKFSITTFRIICQKSFCLKQLYKISKSTNLLPSNPL